MTLSRTIRDLRYAKGWGPDELAYRAKISRTALYQIERGGTSKPQAGTLKRISKALGVPLETLLTTTPAPSVSIETLPADTAAVVPVSSLLLPEVPSSDRADALIEKFRLLLSSPLAEGVARIVEESFRLLPIIPPRATADRPRYAPSVEIDAVQHGSGR
jgi:transcriptional regulator with XRE-family HTH domain